MDIESGKELYPEAIEVLDYYHMGEHLHKLAEVQYGHEVDYEFYRKGGYPVESGGIESFNKTISHVILKRSGAWWYIEKANQMLALRCAKYSRTFQKLILQYMENFVHT